MDPTPDLASLMRFIDENWQFTPERYRNMDTRHEAHRTLFVVRHIKDHLDKALAELTAETEQADHGALMNDTNLRIASTKLLVSTLKLATELGISPDYIAMNVPIVMKK